MRKPTNPIHEEENGRALAAHTALFPCRHVLWDWNGTLLDDRDYAIQVRNRVFPRFGLPPISSVEEYYRQFTFPIRVYYERGGVTEEMFAAVADAWMREYVAGCRAIPLHGQAVEALRAVQAAGLSQAVLSASQADILEKQLNQYGIREYFQDVLGLPHIYATGKADLGRTYLKRISVRPEACVLLGDTLHDADVACEMGVRCILIAGGHQGADRLAEAKAPVCADLMEAAELVLRSE